MTTSRGAATAALLQKAKSALEEHGWQQDGDFADDAGRLSLDGALNYAMTGQPDRPTVGSGITEGAVLDVLIAREYDGTVADWNDEPDRTAGEVHALLNEAIGRLTIKTGG
jgi:hypothetical protein